MKNITLQILACIFLWSCNKENNDPGVVIMGKIPPYTSSKSGMLNSKNSLTLADATKVFVFSGLDLMNGLEARDDGVSSIEDPGALVYSFVDIVDGSFTANVEMGRLTALVFLNGNNQYIGTLSTQGLNLLPLINLTEGENTIIDLSTLTLVGSSVIPAYDPLGNEIIITEAEINSLKEIDGYFESLAKNLDTDSDGNLDLLDHKQIYIKSVFEFDAGQYGINNTPASISESVTESIQYGLHILGGKGIPHPGSIVLTGPDTNPYSDIHGGANGVNENWGMGFRCGYYRGDHDSNKPFEKGNYTLTLDGKLYTFNYSNIDVKYNLVIATPTLNTNSEGKLVSVSIKYQHSDYSIVNPENILTEIGFHLNDMSTNRQIYFSKFMTTRKTNYGDMSRDVNLHTLDNPIDITGLNQITIGYTDLLGNQYMVKWHNF